MNEDLQRLVMGFVILIPLAFPLRRLPTKAVRETYSLVLALALQLWVFRFNMIVIYIQQAIAFFILRFKGPKCGAIITIQGMIAIACYHLYEVFYNYGGWTMDASALMMILVCKYSLLGYALQDGTKEEEELSVRQQANKVTGPISLWDFLGYTNFLPTCLIGPPFEYRDYLSFMSLSGRYKEVPSVHKLLGDTFLETALLSLFYIAGEVYYPISFMKTEQFFLMEPYQVTLYAVISIFLVRFKYYVGWNLGLMSVHASGLSYDGKGFKQVRASEPYTIETSIHLKDKINLWNISVQEWLGKCIYERAPFQSKAIRKLYVFLVSAFWHGFYFGYYLSFVAWFMQLHLQEIIFKYSQNNEAFLVSIYKKTQPISKIIAFISVNCLFNLNGAFFMILEGQLCVRYLQKLHYLPIIILFALITVFTVIGKGRKPDTKRKQ